MNLLPCPFCGATDDVVAGGKLHSHYVICMDCGVQTANERAERLAINIWNSRAHPSSMSYEQRLPLSEVSWPDAIGGIVAILILMSPFVAMAWR